MYFIFLKLFLISAHQNHLNILKNINLKLQKNFEIQKKTCSNVI
jgi:hypothetical protein